MMSKKESGKNLYNALMNDSKSVFYATDKITRHYKISKKLII